jgi:hypothetical protein
MALDPNEPHGRPAVPGPLPAATQALVAVLILIPLVALAIVPVYSRATPRLWGFPFFYWYQFLWVFLASACTYAAYVAITRARRGARR